MDKIVLAQVAGSNAGLVLSWEITIGQIVTTLITLGGVAWAAMSFFAAMKTSIMLQAKLSESALNTVSEKLVTLGGRVVNIETELREINRTMSVIAVQAERLSGLDRRIDETDRRVGELRTWCTDVWKAKGDG